jgi:NTE family protein
MIATVTTKLARPLARGCVAVCALVLASCASFEVADTTPLQPDQLLPPGSDSISRGGYRLTALRAAAETPDFLVVAAFSGGGKRSAAFSFGALEGMRELTVPTAVGPRSLLSQVDAISGVSGGSFTAAYYGLYREAAFQHYPEDFLYKDTEAYIYGIYLFPWNWTWLVSSDVGTNDYMEQVYDRTLFHGATYADLARLGRPLIQIDATEIAYGRPFVFAQETFDLLCADLEKFPLARAVAASNAFPGLFTPVTLTNHTAKCGGRVPGWVSRVTPAEQNNPLSRVGADARATQEYLNPKKLAYVHLLDGGVSDNLALRPDGDQLQKMAQEPVTITDRGFTALRRILAISVDGQGAQDTSAAQRRAAGGIFAIFGLVSGTQIDRYNFETLTTVSAQLDAFTRALVAARCKIAPTIDGFPCDDVKVALVRVSLADIPEGPEKEQLLAIPTGLSIGRQNADLLIAAGRQAILHSTDLADFLADYHPVPAGPAARPTVHASLPAGPAIR